MVVRVTKDFHVQEQFNTGHERLEATFFRRKTCSARLVLRTRKQVRLVSD